MRQFLVLVTCSLGLGIFSSFGCAKDQPATNQMVCPSNPDDLISDFKTDNGIQPVMGRSGGWYLYPDMNPDTGDPNGMFDPPLPPPNVGYPIDTTMGNPYCSGPGSFHTKATGFTKFGAALATDFVPQVDAGMVKGSYDASMYKGIAFWAKGAKRINHVQIKFPDIYTDPQVPNPMCVLATGFDNNCSPYIVKIGDEADNPKYLMMHIEANWKRFVIMFADAVQDKFNPGFHRPAPDDHLDVKNLLGVAIQVNADFSVTPTAANDFEIWIDDVEFVR
jgi:hypothetical protein